MKVSATNKLAISHYQRIVRCGIELGLDNPTSEMIALWIWEKLSEQLPLLAEIIVHETCTSRCHYLGPVG